MRLALISDIHGNLAALEAVLAAIEAEPIDQIVCLGDVSATGPQPRAVLQRLRDINCAVVMGNADAELLSPATTDDSTSDDMRRFLDMSAWAAAQLDEADRAYLASFQPTVAIDLGEAGRLLCCHGSPRSYDDIIRANTADEDLAPMLAGTEATVQAGGHTHIRMLRAWQGREIVNPGSVGLAYQFRPDGSVRVPPWAEYAVLKSDGEAVSIDFWRIPYDRDATVRAMFENGMPHAEWWAEGWV